MQITEKLHQTFEMKDDRIGISTDKGLIYIDPTTGNVISKDTTLKGPISVTLNNEYFFQDSFLWYDEVNNIKTIENFKRISNDGRYILTINEQNSICRVYQTSSLRKDPELQIENFDFEFHVENLIFADFSENSEYIFVYFVEYKNFYDGKALLIYSIEFKKFISFQSYITSHREFHFYDNFLFFTNGSERTCEKIYRIGFPNSLKIAPQLFTDLNFQFN